IRDGHVTGVQTCALPIRSTDEVVERGLDVPIAVPTEVHGATTAAAHSPRVIQQHPVPVACEHDRLVQHRAASGRGAVQQDNASVDRKSTHLNSSHVAISY